MDLLTDRELLLILGGLLLFLIVICMVFISVLWTKLGNLRKKYYRMMGETGINDLEEALSAIQTKTANLISSQDVIATTIGNIELTIKKVKGNVGICRYNAFGERGNDLSFSVAIFDQEQDGVVITSIYGREESHVYAKPIVKGQSNYALTPEEKQAIESALRPQLP